MKKAFLVLGIFASVGCFESGTIRNICSNNPNLNCQVESEANEDSATVLIEDSFERSTLLSDSTPEFSLWWRKIINDRGIIFNSIPGPYVDAAIFSSQQMGSPVADGDRALYFYGREGASIHNIYLISNSFDLSQYENVDISFQYLPIDLDSDDYFSLEVCAGTLTECGVPESGITVAGLNSANWESIWEADKRGDGLNGKNHSLADWHSANILFDLNSLETSQFTFRINVRVDEGFVRNTLMGAMEDGVAIDSIRVRAAQATGF